MAKLRVHEVAKDIGVASKEVLAHLEKIGEPVKSHASTIEEDLAARVKAEMTGGGNGAASDSKAASKAPEKKAPEKKTPAPKPAAKASDKAPEKKAPEKKAPEPAPAKPAAAAPAPTPAAHPKADAPKPAAAKPAAPTAPPPAKAPASKPTSGAGSAPPKGARPAEQPAAAAPPAAPAADQITVHRGITVKDFAERVDRPANEIVKLLIGLGEMVTVTQSMSDEAIMLVADEISAPVKIVDPSQAEPEAEAEPEEEVDPSQLIERPPVVTVMGHVDHGKTAILDAIRKTNVAGGEAGGITQAIGAYQVNVSDRDITFIDTPGHEAFTAMRARGAQATDIAVLVVAADDGVMPQTIEAVDHAKAAQVPIVVAVNKVDKEDADPSRVRQQLSERELIPEEWGGETIFVDVSAKQRTNLDGLLEMILLTADVQLDLKANPTGHARGVVIEAHLDKGRGPVATVLVKRGTLRNSDALLAGAAWGRVRAMLDHEGNQVEEAAPGQPVQVLGWQALPEAGDDFRVLDDEKSAKSQAAQREHRRRDAELVTQRGMSLEQLLEVTGEGETPELNLLLKSDTQGSAEALADQLAKLDQSLVTLNIVRKGVGGITENDVTLAQASNAIIIGFNVVPMGQAQSQADEAGVDIRTYRIIYKALEDIENAAKGLLGPDMREVPIGQAEVRQVFRVPRQGAVAGSMILDGKITRNSSARLVRDGTVIYETTIASLRRFKDDVREVAAGYECGIGLEGFQDIKEGDIIQAFEMQEVAR